MKKMRLILILLLLATPSLLVCLDSCSGKEPPALDTARINALCDSIDRLNMWNATVAACTIDDADSLEEMHGEDIHTGVIKMQSEDIVENAFKTDSLIDEILLTIKKTYK